MDTDTDASAAPAAKRRAHAASMKGGKGRRSRQAGFSAAGTDGGSAAADKTGGTSHRIGGSRRRQNRRFGRSIEGCRRGAKSI